MMKIWLIIEIILLGFLNACNVTVHQEEIDKTSIDAIPTSQTITTQPSPTITTQPTPTAKTCLSSGNQDDINALLIGEGSSVVLCQDALFELTGSVEFNADHQQIYTEGLPEDEHRALLRISSDNETTAVLMRDYSDVTLRNVIVDGNRPNLGYKEGQALIYAGGYSSGQVIQGNKIVEPRSWSALQLIEPCDNALVEDNEINSAGQPDGTWADGISLACTNTIVRNNRIIDATDGAIVIFEATGSTIEDNLIRAETKTLLGGIHLVSSEVYEGNYTGTIIQNNIIESAGAVIRIAVPMGPRVWLCIDENEDVETIYGATIINNILRGDQVQYGFIVDGVVDWTVMDNIDEATHIGVPTNHCNGRIPSKPAGFMYNPDRSEGNFQPEFISAFLELALWAILEPLP